MNNGFIKVSLMAFVMFTAGCATTGSVQEASNTANAAKQTADAASAAVAEALQTAKNAQSTADEAHKLATQALQVANEAKAAGLEANTKIDRSFKKSMAK